MKNGENEKFNGVVNKKLKGSKKNIEDEIFRFFDDVLDSNEKIVKGYKPNKSKFAWSYLLSPITIFTMFFVFAIVVALCGEEPMPLKEGLIVFLCVVLPLFVLMIVFCFVCMALSYKNTFYVLTNKKIIVRSGVFGIHFHSLEIESIGASSVCVTALDKMIRKNTGTIKFGSNASPMNASGTMFSFLHIQDPYQVYKEIKEYIQAQKSAKE